MMSRWLALCVVTALATVVVNTHGSWLSEDSTAPEVTAMQTRAFLESVDRKVDEKARYEPLPMEAQPSGLPVRPRRTRPRWVRNLVMHFDFGHRMVSEDYRGPVRISSVPRLCSSEYTISFWLKVNGDPGKTWRTIFYKGADKSNRAPALFLHPVEKKLQLHVTTQDDSITVLDTNTSIPLYTPVHVAILRKDHLTQIYINGKLDSEQHTLDINLCNKGPLLINPEIFELKSFTGSVRNFKWFSTALNPADIRRLTFEGFESAVVRFDYQKKYNGESEDGDIFPHDDHMNSNDFTVAFWFNLHEGPTGIPRRIVQKGSTSDELAPGVTLSPDNNKISVRMNTEAYRTEGLLSSREVRLDQPTHIAVVRKANSLRLYLDGLLDKEVLLSSPTVFNKGPLFIGRSSSSATSNGVNGEVYGFRWFARAYFGHEVRELSERTSLLPEVTSGSSQEESVTALRFPHTNRLDSDRFTISFWINLLSPKFKEPVGGAIAAVKDYTDEIEDSEDEDESTSEQDMLDDENAEAQLIRQESLLDGEENAVPKEESSMERRVEDSKDISGTRIPPSQVLGANGTADTDLPLEDKADASGRKSDDRYAAYDAEHQGDYDDDLHSEDGYEEEEDPSEKNGGAQWTDNEIIEQELREAEREDFRDAHNAGDSVNDMELPSSEDGNNPGVNPISDDEAKKPYIEHRKEDQYTGYGDYVPGEDHGRRTTRGVHNLKSNPDTPDRWDEEGDHRFDDDWKPAQKVDEEGEHHGDTVDDNQKSNDAIRNVADDDIDTELYHPSHNPRISDSTVQEVRQLRPVDREQVLREVNEKEAMEDLERRGLNLDHPERPAPPEEEEDPYVPRYQEGEGDSASRSLLSISDDILDEIVNSALLGEKEAMMHRAAPTQSSSEPANPLAGELKTKEHDLTEPEISAGAEDSDDSQIQKIKEDNVDVDPDGEEAMDEPRQLTKSDFTSEHRAVEGEMEHPVAPSEDIDPLLRDAAAASQKQTEHDITDSKELHGTETSEARDMKHDGNASDETRPEGEIDANKIDKQIEREANEAEEEEEDEDARGLPETTSSIPTSIRANDRSGDSPSEATREAPDTDLQHDLKDGIPSVPSATKDDEADVDDTNFREGDYVNGAAPERVSLFNAGILPTQTTPSMLLLPESLKLASRVSSRKSWNEGFTSATSLSTKQPNHVAYVLDGRVLRLYLDGVLDKQLRISSRVKFNKGPLRVAEGLRRAGLNAQIYDLEYHSRALRSDELREVEYAESIPLHCYYSELVGDHLFSSKKIMKGVYNYRYQGIRGWIMNGEVSGTVPLYRYYNPQIADHRYSTVELGSDGEDKGWFYSGIEGYVYARQRDGSAALLEYYHPLIGDHFYTVDPDETKDPFYAGYEYRGKVAYVMLEREESKPLYRLYDRKPLGTAVVDVSYRGSFDGRQPVRVLSTALARNKEFFTVFFDLFLTEDSAGKPRVVFRKGRDRVEQTPSMYIADKSRHLVLKLTTADGKVHSLTTKTQIPLMSLTNVVYVQEGDTAMIYINGFLDSKLPLPDDLKHNADDLLIGAGRLKEGIDGIKGRIPDFRWYGRALQREEILRGTAVTRERPALMLEYGAPFDGSRMAEIENQDAFQSQDYTVLVNLNMKETCANKDSAGCYVFFKGGRDGTGAPTLAVNSAGNVVVSFHNGSSITSQKTIEPATLTAVTIVKEGKKGYLYIEGVLDGEIDVPTEGGNNFPLYIGSSPGSADGNGYNGFVTELRWYQRSFSQSEILEYVDHRMEPMLLQLTRKNVFHPSAKIQFPHAERFHTVGSTISFWIKLAHHNDADVHVISKGHERNRLSAGVFLASDGRVVFEGEGTKFTHRVQSTSLVPLNMPTHISVVKAGRLLKIYVNGELDSEHIADEEISRNNGPINIGRLNDIESFYGWIKGVRWHGYALQPHEIARGMRETAD